MSDDEEPKYRAEVVAATLAGGLDAVLDQPLGTVLAAAAAPALLSLVRSVGTEWTAIREARAARVFQVAADETALDPEQLAARLTGSETLIELAGAAAQGATGARYDSRIVALGKALASGLLADDDTKIDDELLFVEALKSLDRPHLRLLKFLSDQALSAGEVDPVSLALAAMPDLRPVAGSLIATLDRYHLVQRLPELKFRPDWKINGPQQVAEAVSYRLVVTDFGRDVLRRLLDAGESEGMNARQIRPTRTMV